MTGEMPYDFTSNTIERGVEQVFALWNPSRIVQTPEVFLMSDEQIAKNSAPRILPAQHPSLPRR